MIGILVYRHYAAQKGLWDIPNARSAHAAPVPRGAGVVFVVLWLLHLCWNTWQHQLSSAQFLLLVPTTFMIALVGFLDDCYGISAIKRLFCQALIAIVFLIFLGHVGYSTLALALALIALIGSINAYNFMDGLDGFSAVEAVFVFGIGGWLFWHQAILDLAFANWSLVACVLGFLIWNWPKAKVFMGDVGSYALGFCVAAFAVIAAQRDQISPVLWLILYGVFVFDATITLFRRLWHKENITQAHCLHAYQRLYQAGVCNRKILMGLIVLNSVLGGLVVWIYLRPPYIWAGFCLALIILAAVYGAIERINPMWIPSGRDKKK